MKKYFLFKLLLIPIAVVSFVLPALADEPKPSESKDLNFTAGGEIRLRQEIWTNVTSLDTNNAAKYKDRDFIRMKMSLWGKVDVGKNFDAFAKITSEPRYYLGPYHPSLTGYTSGQYFDQDEVFFDNLYVSGKKLFNGLVDLRVGRQDFMAPDDIYGEGFLIFDGTPADGSRSFYFNAAKARINFTNDNSVDLVYVTDMDTDSMLPLVHPAVSGSGYISNKHMLTTSHEQAVIVYGRNRFGNIVTFDPYYIYKIEDGFLTNPRLKLHTFGGRVTVNYDNWKVRGELAYQFGQYDSNSAYKDGIDRTGLGGYLFFGRQFKDIMWKPEIELGGVYYSGDDPSDSSNKRKAFDPLFSRAPLWNDLYCYTLTSENSSKYANGVPGYWTNVAILMLKAKANITNATALSLVYQYLMAPQKTSGLDSSMFSNNSRDRGHLPSAVLNQKIMKNLDGLLQFEYFMPGKFYASTAKDAIFLKWQLTYKF
jgi:hypothetical protein